MEKKFLLVLKFAFWETLFLSLLKGWDVTNPSPLQKISSRDLKEKLGTKEIWEFLLHIFFSLPSGFFFGVVAPLNLQELDTPGAGGPESFFKDTNRHFAIGQVLVNIHRSMINVFEHLRLLRNF